MKDWPFKVRMPLFTKRLQLLEQGYIKFPDFTHSAPPTSIIYESNIIVYCINVTPPPFPHTMAYNGLYWLKKIINEIILFSSPVSVLYRIYSLSYLGWWIWTYFWNLVLNIRCSTILMFWSRWIFWNMCPLIAISTGANFNKLGWMVSLMILTGLNAETET